MAPLDRKPQESLPPPQFIRLSAMLPVTSLGFSGHYHFNLACHLKGNPA
jgi:hypothetical protein